MPTHEPQALATGAHATPLPEVFKKGTDVITSRTRRSILARAIGERLRELREAADLSQEELGAGRYSKSMISKIESGNALPSLETLVILAGRLELPLREMFPRTLRGTSASRGNGPGRASRS